MGPCAPATARARCTARRRRAAAVAAALGRLGGFSSAGEFRIVSRFASASRSCRRRCKHRVFSCSPAPREVLRICIRVLRHGKNAVLVWRFRTACVGVRLEVIGRGAPPAFRVYRREGVTAHPTRASASKTAERIEGPGAPRDCCIRASASDVNAARCREPDASRKVVSSIFAVETVFT